MDEDHTIHEFLQRPTKIFELPILNSDGHVLNEFNDTAQKPYFTLHIPSDLIKRRFFNEKLSGFAYFKADVEIRITFNITPLISSSFFVVYAPYNDTSLPDRKIENYGRKGITSFPSLIIDPQVDTVVSFTVPYISVKESYDLKSEELDYCVLQMYSLTPIRFDGENPGVHVSLYANFKNIQLIGANSQDMFIPFDKSVHNIKFQSYSDELKTITDATQILDINFQIKKGHNKKVKTEQKEKGVISEIASTVSGVASSLSGIPVIGEIASGIGWVSNLVGGVASLFGWSKPITYAENTMITNTPAFGFTHTKGVDTSCALATSQEYELGPPNDIFQTDIDEMDIEYICNNPSVIDVIQWKVGTDLNNTYKLALTPKDQDLVFLTPAEFVGTLFTYFRATFVFKFKIIKTPFHSGRIEFGFSPQRNKGFSGNFDNNYRATLDITKETEITIRVPFISDVAFIGTYYGTEMMGRLNVRGTTPLMKAGAVSDTVDIIVTEWLEDVMFMYPSHKHNYINATGSTARMVENIEFQISIGNKQGGNVVTLGCPSGNERDKNIEALKLCGGEAVVNLRTLLRSSTFFNNFTGNFKLNANVNNLGTDFVSYISSIFRMYRGGIRYKVFSQPQDNGMIHSYINDYKTTCKTPQHITYSHINPVHEVAVPYYVQVRRMVLNSNTRPQNSPFVHFNNTNSSKVAVFRSGDDDLTFGWMIGVPPIKRVPFNGDIFGPDPVLPDVPKKIYHSKFYKCQFKNFANGFLPLTFISIEGKATDTVKENSEVNISFYNSFGTFYGNLWQCKFTRTTNTPSMETNLWYTLYDVLGLIFCQVMFLLDEPLPTP